MKKRGDISIPSGHSGQEQVRQEATDDTSMKDLEQYLRDNKPGKPGSENFMIELNAKMEAVEGIKKTVAEERKHSRTALVYALIAGIVLGCLLTLFVMLVPSPAETLGSETISNIVAFLREWQILLALPIAGCAITLGLLGLKRREA